MKILMLRFWIWENLVKIIKAKYLIHVELQLSER